VRGAAAPTTRGDFSVKPRYWVVKSITGSYKVGVKQ
jgi:hypothetical protein